MNMPIFFVVISLFLIWVGVLTFFVFRFYSYFMHLTKSPKGDSFLSILDELMKKTKENEMVLEKLSKHCDKLDKEGSLHIQKVGLVRFNPFKDTGGDQSFILALVDGQDSGVVISSLHTRTGTRWYAKRVEKGKGVEYALSDEEQKALEGASVIR